MIRIICEQNQESSSYHVASSLAPWEIDKS